MKPFEELFRKSNGQPVLYNGITIQLFDVLEVANGQEFKVIFESMNSNWRQGIRLSTDGSFDGNGQNAAKAIVLWWNTAPSEIVLRVHTKKGKGFIANVWDNGDGAMRYGSNGAAMIVEKTAYGRRHKCNDGRANDDFNDLIFRIELSK